LTTTGSVPPWITGLDGNPLAGLLGLGLLLLLGILIFRRSRLPKLQPDTGRERGL
jgi:uncharacterized protein